MFPKGELHSLPLSTTITSMEKNNQNSSSESSDRVVKELNQSKFKTKSWDANVEYLILIAFDWIFGRK